MTWTDEAVDELKRLHSGGLFSCGEIADRLALEFKQTISRNAVIGKLLRLGLHNSRSVGSQPRKPRNSRTQPREIKWPRQAAAEPTPAPEPMPDTPDDQIPATQRRTLLELENEHCRYPVGDPASPDFFFCAHPSADVNGGRSYCRMHTNICSSGSPAARPFIPMRNDRV